MVLTSSITLTSTSSNETITLIHDNCNLISRFISYIHSRNEYTETYDNTFVFSEKESFDNCAAEAKDIGLLPC